MFFVRKCSTQSEAPVAIKAAELFMSNILETAVRICGMADACPVALFSGSPLML